MVRNSILFGNNIVGMVVMMVFMFAMTSCSVMVVEKPLVDLDSEPIQKIEDERRWLLELTNAKYLGRKTGSRECKLASEYIAAELLDMGYTPYYQEFLFKDSIVMRNVLVKIPGQTDSLVVIGAHYDGAVLSTEHSAANDNASGVVTLLSIAKGLTETQFNSTALLCFWDGEESTSRSVFNGSSYFVNTIDHADRIKWYCNLDCCGRQDSNIYYFYSQVLQDDCNKALDLVLKQDTDILPIIRKVKDKQGSDYESFARRGIPIWGWCDIGVLEYIHTQKDVVNMISVEKIQSVARKTLGVSLLLN